MSKKLGLALGAGGARGVAHIGFLQALEEEGIKADCVTGCSMGSIVGALYCAGVPLATVKEKVLGLTLKSITSLNISPIRASGLFRMTKVRKLLCDYMGDRDFQDLEIPFACVATDLVDGKTVLLDKGNVLDSVLASSSMPGAFSPVPKGDMLLVDGGILERVPTKPLKSKMGADVVVAVDVLGDLMIKETPENLVEVVVRCVEVMDTHSTKNKRRSRMKNIELWLEPDLGDMDQYHVKNLEFAYRKGYELGKANTDKIKELLKD